MVLNTQQLQNLVEIERTRSISQAAANLYMGQPNLSRMLRDTEEALGFPIFERTRKGVRPTPQGEQFLRHARNILREAEFVERLGPNSILPNRFRVALPRSFRFTELTQQYLRELPEGTELDGLIRECHPRQALEMLGSGQIEAAVIRYSTEYQDYFLEQAQGHSLSLHLLSRTEFLVTLSKAHPLAGQTGIAREALQPFAELRHRDVFYPEKETHSSLYTVDRLAQLQLLQGLPNTYLWSEPLPELLLTYGRLCQIKCADGGPQYQNALLFKPQCAMSQLESGFLDWIREKG